MNEQTIELIKNFASQAVSTFKGIAPQVWEMVQRRIIIESLAEIGIFIFLCIISIPLYFVSKYAIVNLDFNEWIVIAWALWAVFFIIFFVVAIFCIIDLNTLDYATLTRIINDAKGN